MRLDADVIARFRASAPGWHDRVNASLRRALG
ncbi:BrnA antitoxin family protein [Methylobacterium sp. Leaf399]|nr:BrnA antitoxin family protein [Methylobacterium sp. Leaf399]